MCVNVIVVMWFRETDVFLTYSLYIIRRNKINYKCYMVQTKLMYKYKHYTASAKEENNSDAFRVQ